MTSDQSSGIESDTTGRRSLANAITSTLGNLGTIRICLHGTTRTLTSHVITYIPGP
jgi:hypothetical protein